jgi:hypothetical protein
MQAAVARMIREELQKMGRNGQLGQNIDQQQEIFLEKRRDFYIYESEAISLAAGTNATDTIQIEADSNFILQKLTQFSVPSADSAAVFPDLTDDTIVFPVGLTNMQTVKPAVALQLIDTGSGRQLMQNPIPIPSFFGTGEMPFILPNPRLFVRNSTIQVAYTNFDTVNDYDVRLAFIGYKVYGTV